MEYLSISCFLSSQCPSLPPRGIYLIYFSKSGKVSGHEGGTTAKGPKSGHKGSKNVVVTPAGNSAAVIPPKRKGRKPISERATASAMMSVMLEDGGVDNNYRSTWAHARAALVLRTKIVATALQWVAAAKTIQVSGLNGSDKRR